MNEVKKIGIIFLSVMAGVMIAVSPVAAKGHKMAAKPKVTCKQIKDAIAGGKSADDAAKDLSVSAARVKSCTTAPKKHKRTAKK